MRWFSFIFFYANKTTHVWLMEESISQCVWVCVRAVVYVCVCQSISLCVFLTKLCMHVWRSVCQFLCVCVCVCFSQCVCIFCQCVCMCMWVWSTLLFFSRMQQKLFVGKNFALRPHTHRSSWSHYGDTREPAVGYGGTKYGHCPMGV
jgi:hypothetical protein